MVRQAWQVSPHGLLNHPNPYLFHQGLPYIPRVHLSEGSLVRCPLRWLCSEEPVVRRSFIPKLILSEGCYVPKIPYSENHLPTIPVLYYEGSLVRSSSCSKVAMLRFYFPNIAHSVWTLCYRFLVRKFESWILYAVTIVQLITSQS